jgi:hypothetical protein
MSNIQIIEHSADIAERQSPGQVACNCAAHEYPGNFGDTAKSLLYYYHHKALKNQSRKDYNECYNNCLPTECHLTFDFKENISINRGPMEGSKSFYQRSQRSVLGFLLVYRDPATNKTIHHYIDSISQCLSHDSDAA